MSHFTVGVIVRNDAEDIEEEISRLLEPYNEQTAVEPYTTKCYCVGNEAHFFGMKRADERIEEEMFSLDELRDRFHKDAHYLELAGDREWHELFGDESIDEYWQQYSKEWSNRHREIMFEEARQHPMYQKPNPECDTCSGTGEYMTTYNPKSQWDWWRIGGRWDGSLVENPQSSEGGFNFDERHQQLPGNSVPLEELVQRWDAGKPFVFYALVTPDGEWHQRGKMGWFGMSSDEMPKEAWHQNVIDIYRKYADHCDIVMVDCHI